MQINTFAWIAVLGLMILSAVGAVMIRNMLGGAVMLGVTSAILTIVLFLMGAHLAAIMELSVCAGLVTAVFATTISLTKNYEGEELAALKKERLNRFLPLPFLLILLTVGVFILFPNKDLSILGENFLDASTRQVLWEHGAVDIIGLALIILAGVLGVPVLFRERKGK